MTQTVIVKETIKVEFDGSLDDYVEMAWRKSGFSLDSKDGGDATGWYVQEFHRQSCPGGMWPNYDENSHSLVLRSPDDAGQWSDLQILVTVTCEQDFFVWDPPL